MTGATEQTGAERKILVTAELTGATGAKENYSELP